jgi:hypothetical protein
MRAWMALFLVSGYAGLVHGDTLAVVFQYKDISVDGTFGFKPGGGLKISGEDKLGKPYSLVVTSSKAGSASDPGLKVNCELNRMAEKPVEKQGVTIVIAKNNEGVLHSGTVDDSGKEHELTFKAKWLGQ